MNFKAKDLFANPTRPYLLGVEECTHWLQDKGIEQGDKVGVQLENSEGYITLLYALWNLGATPCLLNTYHKDHSYIETQIKLKTILTELPPFELTPPKYKNGFLFQQTELKYFKVILWTSGSSSTPKALQLNLENLAYNALGSNENIPLTTEDTWLISLPLFHVGALSIIFRCLLAQANYVVEKNIPEALNNHVITHMSLVPTQLQRLLKKNQLQPEHLKCILVGGARLNQKVQDLPIVRTYGMSEMGSQVASPTLLKYRELKIENQEILVKGNCLFEGYWQKQELTLPIDKEGWFHTGDLGELVEGQLTVHGRKDRMFTCAGENIQPEYIEKVLLQHPQIKNCYVTQKVDSECGHVPIAYLETDLTEEDLQSYFVDNLPGLMRPQEILEWSSRPLKSFKG